MLPMRTPIRLPVSAPVGRVMNPPRLYEDDGREMIMARLGERGIGAHDPFADPCRGDIADTQTQPLEDLGIGFRDQDFEVQAEFACEIADEFEFETSRPSIGDEIIAGVEASDDTQHVPRLDPIEIARRRPHRRDRGVITQGR